MADPAQERIVISGPDALLEVLSGSLFEAGAGGIVEEAGCLVVYPLDDAQKRLFLDVIRTAFDQAQVGPNDHPTDVTVESVDPNWQQIWTRQLRPEKISASFTLRPTHVPLTSEDEGERTLWFEPEASFGSGDHPTTRLAATWLEEYARAHECLSCFDVGTGTGVLAFVIARSGTHQILAVDIDEVAVRSAERNLELNQPIDGITVARGSADSSDAQFDLVVANINTHILLAIMEDLCARVAPGGKLLLTGLLIEDISDIEAETARNGFRLIEKRTEGDWALLILGR